MSPKVSVIVPIYNPPKDYLHECIQSILNQTLTDIEIILIDNAALGECPQIAKDYAAKDSRIKLFCFEENRGFPGACNQGLDIATGDYVQIVDSDDYIALNACQILYDKAVATDSDMVFLSAHLYDCKKNLATPSSQREYEWSGLPDSIKDKVFNFEDVKECIFLAPSQAWNKFYKRSFLVNSNATFDMDLTHALPDALFSFKNYYRAKRMTLLRDILYFYRVNIGTSVVGGLSKKDCTYFNEGIIFLEKLDEFQIENNVTAEHKKYFVKIQLKASQFVYQMVHNRNKGTFFLMLKQHFSKLNPTIYTPENIAYSECADWVNAVLTKSHLRTLINPKRLALWVLRFNDGTATFCGIPIYQRKQDNGIVTRIYFWFLFKTVTSNTNRRRYVCGIKIP